MRFILASYEMLKETNPELSPLRLPPSAYEIFHFCASGSLRSATNARVCLEGKRHGMWRYFLVPPGTLCISLSKPQLYHSLPKVHCSLLKNPILLYDRLGRTRAEATFRWVREMTWGRRPCRYLFSCMFCTLNCVSATMVTSCVRFAEVQSFKRMSDLWTGLIHPVYSSISPSPVGEAIPPDSASPPASLSPLDCPTSDATRISGGFSHCKTG
ncbi:hypothetical protein C8R47DRAFT_1167856 [Mycena vitilis]|nr:hypothetical protein C8R47DRAFT_1167856 [Mycena vitilis]